MKVTVTLYYHTTCEVEVDVNPFDFDNEEDVRRYAIDMAESDSSDETNSQLMSNLTPDGDPDVEIPEGLRDKDLHYNHILELIARYFPNGLNCDEEGVCIQWSVWDDDIDFRTDDNGIDMDAKSIFIGDEGSLCIEWEDGKVDTCDSMMEDGDEFCLIDYIHDELEHVFDKFDM